jgi:hypothetical protein
MLFANFMRRSGAQFIASLVVMFNGVLPAQARIRPNRSTVLYCSSQNLANGLRGGWVSIVLHGRYRQHCAPGSRARQNSKQITDAVISAADFHSPALPNPREPISNEAQRQPCVECVDALAPTGSTSNYYVSNDPNSGVLRFLTMPG